MFLSRKLAVQDHHIFSQLSYCNICLSLSQLKDAFVDVTCALFALKLLRNLFPTAANEIVAMLRTCFALECAVLLSSTMIHPSGDGDKCTTCSITILF